ncbi:MAG TPA: hypothetical protein VK629_20865 [Steroidobacteraceae bacterium]|nr:hypothetical protein [Steroidobacteraceae bacterium]
MSVQSPAQSFLKSLTRAPMLVSLALLVVLIGTRSQFVVEYLHFAPEYRAPDATLAIFFLAGLWISSGRFAGVLLAAAALADQIAFANGVPDWCFTAAYACLIPAYLAMWAAGRYCSGANVMSANGLLKMASTLVVACFLEFVISSGSFFLFSGYFSAMPAAEYWSKTIGYYPQYLGWAAVYIVAGLAIAMAIRPVRSDATQKIA